MDRSILLKSSQAFTLPMILHLKASDGELVVEDYVYAVKRILDPKNHAPSFSFIDNKLLGANALVEQEQDQGKFVMMHRLRVKALDKYTIQFTLTQPDYNFPIFLPIAPLAQRLGK